VAAWLRTHVPTVAQAASMPAAPVFTHHRSARQCGAGAVKGDARTPRMVVPPQYRGYAAAAALWSRTQAP
jgi:hypothetical protein